MSDLGFIDATRQDDLEWYLSAATLWVSHGRPAALESPLVYGALEAQRALETYALAFVQCLWGGELEEEQSERMETPEGLFDQVEELTTFYRSARAFTQLAIESVSNRPTIPTLEPHELRRRWLRLEAMVRSRHNQTVQDYAYLQETIDWLKTIPLEDVFSILEPETMPPEMQSLFERFLRGEVDDNDVRRNIRLMEPALVARTLQIEAIVGNGYEVH